MGNSIRDEELESGRFLNSNFKGTPSQGKHKLFYPPNDF